MRESARTQLLGETFPGVDPSMGDHVGAELADRVEYLLGEIGILVADAYQQLDQQRKEEVPSVLLRFLPLPFGGFGSMLRRALCHHIDGARSDGFGSHPPPSGALNGKTRNLRGFVFVGIVRRRDRAARSGLAQV